MKYFIKLIFILFNQLILYTEGGRAVTEVRFYNKIIDTGFLFLKYRKYDAEQL